MTVYDDVLDGRFRDRLKLDNQTGSLTITDTRTTDSGRYKLQMNSVGKCFKITVFGVLKSVSVKEGESVTLNSGVTEIMDDDMLQWRDRLKLDNQTGSLTIRNITTQHAGLYKLQTNKLTAIFSLTVYDSEHCCGSTEAVIRLVLSALVGVATVILLVYDIRSRRAEQDQAHLHTSGSTEI
ncbi:hypothetical protein cypCar_00048134 [Cyprinus carpio]|nr:hypothetical protein cypCar_00048134 [Cyprinus carpio]